MYYILFRQNSVLSLTDQINDIETGLNKNIRVVQRLTKHIKVGTVMVIIINNST